MIKDQVSDVYFDEQMLLITHAKGGKQRHVPLLPELTHELRTAICDRTTGPLFTTMRPPRILRDGSSNSCRKQWR